MFSQTPTASSLISNEDLLQEILLRPDKYLYQDVLFYSDLKPDLSSEEMIKFDRLYHDISDWLELNNTGGSNQVTDIRSPWWINHSHIVYNIIPAFVGLIANFGDKSMYLDLASRLCLTYRCWKVRMVINPHMFMNLLKQFKDFALNDFDPILVCTKDMNKQIVEQLMPVHDTILEIDINTIHKRFVSEHFQNLERTLIGFKNLLDKYTTSEREHKKLQVCTKASDPCQTLKTHLKTHVKAKLVTNAWVKMYEMIDQYKLLEDLDEVRLFDNAALPGAGISAVHHLMHTRFSVKKFVWKASSLIEQGALTDQYNLISLYKENWIMDDQMNGDVCISSNLLEIKKRLTDHKTNLYISDLGFDVSEDYNRQEVSHAGPHLGQVLLGIMCLVQGGHLIVKQYTFFSSFSVSIIYLLSQLFEQCYVTKPLSSKGSNSESYIVAKCFKGCADTMVQSILLKLENIDSFFSDKKLPCMQGPTPLFDIQTLPQDFQTRIESVAHQLAFRQIQYLQRLVFLTENSCINERFIHVPIINQSLMDEKEIVKSFWMHAHPVQSFPSDTLFC